MRDAFPRGVVPGAGFYALERHAGLTFRWFRSGAILYVRDARMETIELDIEAGPCAPLPEMTVHVTTVDGVILAGQIFTSRGRVAVPLPSVAHGAQREVRVVLAGTGLSIAGDARMLEARVIAPL